jgi:hypothetical protein
MTYSRISAISMVAALLFVIPASSFPVFAQQATAGNAVVPTLVQFSGALTNSNGKPLTSITGVTFSLYAEQNGGAPLWLETQNVQPDKNGNYSVMLGSTTSQGLTASLFASGQARWLGVQPQGQAEQPRIMLLSVPYALKAGDAQTLGGKPAAAFAAASSGNAASGNGINNSAITGSGTTDYVPLWLSASQLGSSNILQSTAGNLGIRTTSPAANLDVNGTSDIRNTLTLFPNGSAPTLSVNGTAFQVSNTGLVTFVSGQAITGQTGTFSANSSNPVVSVTQSGSGPGLNLTAGKANYGIEASAAAVGILGNAANAGGIGVYGNTDGGIGIYGQDAATSGASVGVSGGSASSSGYGVQGASPYVGVYGVSDGSSQTGNGFTGAGVWGDTGGSTMPIPYAGVLGTADANPAGWFQNNSTGWAALTGYADLSAASGAHGIFGVALCCSNEEAALYGASAGIWGDTGEAAGTASAVVGTADDNWAAHFYNNSATHTTLNAQNDTTTSTGLVFKTTGSHFKGECTIDVKGDLHCTGSKSADVPVDGGARKLALYAVEAPDNWFEDAGSGQLSNGSAHIELDSTFAQTVNTGVEYHVFLTPKGDCKGLYVSNESATSFEVHELGGGTSSIAFDYRIMAKRVGYESVRLEDVTERYRQSAEELAQQRQNRGKHPMPQRPMRRPASPNSVAPPHPPLPVRAAVRPLNTGNK